MLFRVLLVVVLVSIIGLFTHLRGVAIGALLWIFCIILITRSVYKNWRRVNVNHLDKSLSFGIKYMSRQKLNFKAINMICRKYPVVSVTLKRLSILFDDMHFKGQPINYNDYYTNPSWSSSIGNAYYTDRKY